MSVEESIALQLELQVQETGEKLNVLDEQGKWVNTEEWDNFINAWFKLVDYYDGQNGTVISPIALKQYLEITVLLRRLLLSEDLDASRVDDVTEALSTLEHIMSEIVRYGISNLRLDFPNLNI